MTSVTLKLCHIGPDGVIICPKDFKMELVMLWNFPFLLVMQMPGSLAKHQSSFNMHVTSDRQEKFQENESLA